MEGLSQEQKEDIERLREVHGLRQGRCFWNCQLVVSALETEYEYAEGYVISEEVPVPIQHAWLEVDGVVAEVTFDDGPAVRDGAVYFGVVYPKEVVVEQVDERGEASPIAG